MQGSLHRNVQAFFMPANIVVPYIGIRVPPCGTVIEPQASEMSC